MAISFAIADLPVELNVPAFLERAVRQRYSSFIHRSPRTSSSMLPLRLMASGPDGNYLEPVPKVMVTSLDSERVALSGDCRGELDVAAKEGTIQGPNVLAALDALFRLALSLLAPQAGWLLFHGAAILLRDGRWAVLVGQPGDGKSTAAGAFRSFCDELVLVRPYEGGSEAESTPFWNGRAGRAQCAGIVCMRKSDSAGMFRSHGGQAVRALAPHVVRYLRLGASEERIMKMLCSLARQTPVISAHCPTGSQFIPFLTASLASFGYVPVGHADPA